MNIKRTTSWALAGVFLVFASLALVCPMQLNAMMPSAHAGCGSLPQTNGTLGTSMDCIQSHLLAYRSTIAPLSNPELVRALALALAVLVAFVVYEQSRHGAEDHQKLAAVFDTGFQNTNPPIFLLKMQRWLAHCVANENTQAIN